MIAFLRGTLLEKGPASVVLEAGGVGYEVHLTPATLAALPPEGSAAEFFIIESTGLYGGAVSLYGFATRSDRELFLAIKDNVPSTGAKKALEHLDKASRSLPEFVRAVREQDPVRLCAVLGFTSKTAEKLLAGLKDKIDGSLPAGRPTPGGPA
ncbi:MAG: Holliday junction branch migration protein RuvA, partial [Elusimicrobiota bacterium]